MIDWTAFTWEAFATLATGLGALIAALIIGLRQVSIQKVQTRIAERQTLIQLRETQLATLTLRNELFEKRYEVYSSTNDLLVRALQLGGWVDYDDPVQQPFLVGKDKAKFLFKPSVTEELQEIWSKVCAGTATHKEMTAIYQREGHYGEGNPQLQLETSLWLEKKLRTLSEVFGDELKLSDHDAKLS